MTKKQAAVVANGKCWCGCGAALPEGSFFARGHDKSAEAMLTKLLYGPENPVAEYLAAHGYGGANGMCLKAAYEVAMHNSRGMALKAWANARLGTPKRNQ